MDPPEVLLQMLLVGSQSLLPPLLQTQFLVGNLAILRLRTDTQAIPLVHHVMPAQESQPQWPIPLAPSRIEPGHQPLDPLAIPNRMQPVLLADDLGHSAISEALRLVLGALALPRLNRRI